MSCDCDQSDAPAVPDDSPWTNGTTVALDRPFPRTAIGLGAELKNTVCLGSGATAHLGPTGGDLADSAFFHRFRADADAARAAAPGAVIGHDLHPSFVSTRFARSVFKQCVAVQHHHAHGVAAALDAGIELPCIGIICDGTGYGSDGAMWGGEVLLCEASRFRRLAHLRYLPLPGGDLAARETWRPALAWTNEVFDDGKLDQISRGLFAAVPMDRMKIARAQLRAGLNTPRSSSLGRLFDAAAAIAGLCLENKTEGQAPISLEQAAEGSLGEPYPFTMGEPGEGGRVIDWADTARSLIDDALGGASARDMSRRFHATVIEMFAAAAEQAVEDCGIRRIVLSGGCFLNRLLGEGLVARLARVGLSAGVHRRLPPGDTSLSLGQAFVASSIAAHPGKEESR